jgi:hypothetical protein
VFLTKQIFLENSGKSKKIMKFKHIAKSFLQTKQEREGKKERVISSIS